MTRTIIASLMLSMATTSTAQELFRELDYTPERSVFTLNAPTTAAVSVRIYEGDGTAPHDAKPQQGTAIAMAPIGADRWQVSVEGDLLGRQYAFEVDGQESPGVFAKAVTANGQRGVVVDMRQTDPEGWDKDTIAQVAPQDWMIYELHHRDFSIAPSSGVEEAKRGKFLALTDPVALARLQTLGVNAVHILPSFDYASVDETRLDEAQYNWGYDPQNYNVPEGSYASDPYDAMARIREFKQMVQALHTAGMRVILDVVYNHTFDIANSNFTRTFPGYYYRLNADGTPADGSGCGNETASEKALMRQFMLESVRYWVSEYHIDGFRFDLMGIHDIATMNALREALPPHILLYGEGWSAGACAMDSELLAMKANMAQMPGIAAFSDELRDALRGPFSDDSQGAFLAGLPGEEESIKAGIVGMTAHPEVDYTRVNYSTRAWATEPTQCINYVSCHDDMCLVDRLRASISNLSDSELERLDLLAQTIVFTSQGIPFMLAGEEVLRDKQGVHNSYCSPDSINAIDWARAESHPEVYKAYCQLTRLRAEHPAFRLGSTAEISKRLHFLPTQPCFVGYTIDCTGLEGESWQSVTVLLNANRTPLAITLADGTVVNAAPQAATLLLGE